MSKFKKVIMLRNKEEWQYFQKDMITELKSLSWSIKLPSGPESYPCIIYTTVLPSKSQDTEVACCYIYTDNAEELIKLLGSDNLLDFFSSLESKLATDKLNNECPGYEGHKGALGVEGSDENEDKEIIFDDDAYPVNEDYLKINEVDEKTKKCKAEDYVPASAGVLLLTLVSELRSVGALRFERMMETAKEIEKWMIENKEENLQSDLWDLLKRLWNKKDAS